MNEGITCSGLNELIEEELYYGDVVDNLKMHELLKKAKRFYELESAVNRSSMSWAAQYDAAQELARLSRNIMVLKETLDSTRAEDEEQPKVLTPYSGHEMERGKAFVAAMNAPIEQFRQGLTDGRQARRDEYLDSLPPVEDSRSYGR